MKRLFFVNLLQYIYTIYIFHRLPTPLFLLPDFDFVDLRTALPPVYLAVASQTSNGINGGRTENPMPSGTLTRTLAVPAPVTATQPRPRREISAACPLSAHSVALTFV